MSNVITLSREAAFKQAEALRLQREEIEQLQKQAAARAALSREAAERAAAALVTAGVVRPADQAKTAAAIERQPEAAVEILEKLAAERAAPPALGYADASAKAAAAPRETSDEIWNRGFGISQ
jgi:hypothetical protein